MEQIKTLPLNAVKFFYFVAKYGSLSAAAEQLHVTHGAVSKQLKILERHLGVLLFLKQGRNLVLSNSGTILYQCCRRIGKCGSTHATAAPAGTGDFVRADAGDEMVDPQNQPISATI
ncbi:LysR family transcriptional regulator [Pasteurella testudinis]|uniref:LysR family transcriptional regulator n=1 Tax=Pasteurella testudinis TaxID=761 RepID=UPI0040582EBB